MKNSISKQQGGDRHANTPAAVKAMPQAVDPVMRLPDVSRATGLCRTSIYALMRNQKFPASISLTGSRAIGWKASTIANWISSRQQHGVSA